eukprot:8108536-Alexandrium_andersonii.AAC.1
MCIRDRWTDAADVAVTQHSIVTEDLAKGEVVLHACPRLSGLSSSACPIDLLRVDAPLSFGLLEAELRLWKAQVHAEVVLDSRFPALPA